MGKVTRPEEKTPPRSLGARIRYLRTRRGESQEQLAEILFVKREYIAMIENDKRTPNSGLLIKIADRYKASLDYLHGRTNDISENANTSAQFTGLSSKALNAVRFALMRGKCRTYNAHFFVRMNEFRAGANIPSEVDMNNLLNFAIESEVLEELGTALYESLWSASVKNALQGFEVQTDVGSLDKMQRALEATALQRELTEAARREEWAASYRINEILKGVAESYLKTNLENMKPYTVESARDEIERADEINNEYMVRYAGFQFKYAEKALDVATISEGHKVASVRWLERLARRENTEEEYTAWLDSQLKEVPDNGQC